MALNDAELSWLREQKSDAEAASRKLTVVLAVFVLLWLGPLVVNSAQVARRLDDLVARGLPEAAEVVSVAVNGGPPRLGYAYRVAGERHVVADAVFLHDEWIGETLTVLRHPDDPRLSRIDAGVAAADASRARFWTVLPPILFVAWLWLSLRPRGNTLLDPAGGADEGVFGLFLPEDSGRFLVVQMHLVALWTVDWVGEAMDRIAPLSGCGRPVAVLALVLGLAPWWWAMPVWSRYAAAKLSQSSWVGPGHALSLVAFGGGGDARAARVARWLRLGVATTSAWLLWVVWVRWW